MKRFPVVIIILWFIALISCEKNTTLDSLIEEKLSGNWTYEESMDSTITYTKTNNLLANEYGFSFLPDNLFIERKGVGWCGTPPITYGDFEGTWTYKDSLLSITVGYWGGLLDYTWKIKSVNDNYLTIIKAESVIHEE